MYYHFVSRLCPSIRSRLRSSTGSEASLSGLVNRVLVSLFIVHYIQRSFIFPFLIRGGKPTPAVLVLMALVFCMGNGYMQVQPPPPSPSFSSSSQPRHHPPMSPLPSSPSRVNNTAGSLPYALCRVQRRLDIRPSIHRGHSPLLRRNVHQHPSRLHPPQPAQARYSSL